MFKRLPRDNFPDDTETMAFQNYREESRRPFWSLPFHWRRGLLYIGLGLVLILIGVGVLFIYRELSEQETAATPNIPPTVTPITVIMRGNFPPQVTQTFINIPARIDDGLVSGQERGYTFLADEGFSWSLRVEGYEGLAPYVEFYGPEGQLLASATAVDGTASLSYFIDRTGLYAIYLRGENNTGGDYSLFMMPENLP